MISEYPSGKNKKTSKEYSDIEWVKSIVSGIRNIRGEMKIKPSLKISALLQQGDSSDRRRAKDFEYLISRLAGLNSIKWINSDANYPPSAINFLSHLKVMIPLEGLIKPKEEKQRIEKNISKLHLESESLSKQLNNNRFLKNAPSKLVKQQKNRFKEISEELNLLSLQIEEIQKLF